MSSTETSNQRTATRPSVKQIAVTGLFIFLVAFGVRLLSWHDTRREVGKVQSVVADDYKKTARLIRNGGLSGFFSATGPLADPNLLGHPLGYPVVLALLNSIFGESDAVAQFFQITCDAFAGLLIFLIAIELFPFGVGITAGILIALAPQFSWNAVLLLPDTLAVFPLVLAIYFLTRALKRSHLLSFVMAGALVGLSCWLRTNALLMAPWLALVVAVLFAQQRRFTYAAALLSAALVVISPMTIRNWVVFHHFIPASLGAGQTMLEGIADFDPARRFGIPDTDMAILKMEAERYHRPDYYSSLFAPDGIVRERMRLGQAFEVVRNNPIWFASVMVRRAGSMLRLERARVIANGPPVTHELYAGMGQRVWVANPEELFTHAIEKSTGTMFQLSAQDANAVGPAPAQITSDAATYGVQLKSAPFTIVAHRDYDLRIPVRIEEGRVTLNVVGATSARTYASRVIDKAEVKEGIPQPEELVDLPFVSMSNEPVSLELKNAAPMTGRSIIYMGQAELFDLGPASFLWTRYPRLLIGLMQRLFITAVMLPLALIGFAILIKRRRWQSVIILLSVPAYYFCFQSILHTEYRYVLAIHYFVFILVGVALYELTLGLTRLRRSTVAPDCRGYAAAQ